MTDFLLELRSEEIPARMQEKARADLERLFVAELSAAGLAASAITTYATPRRLALIAHGLPERTQAVSEEIKGPRASAPPQALEGFLRKTGLAREHLVERDGILFAVIDKPGRATAEVLAAAIPQIVRAFPWPKAMRWGAPSLSTESPRWVRPLQGVIAILGGEVLDFEVAGVASSAATAGHRFHHPDRITIGGASDYVEKLRAAHVIVDGAERRAIIAEGARAAARAAGLDLIEDEGLLFENAGLTEYPVPLLGRFDPAFLDVPPEVIQLTARVNQKYFVCRDADGALANAFVCVANVAAADGGARIVEGNQKVLAARLSDARFFYETDLKTPLAEQAKKLEKIVFHEKLGTVADKVERVAKLARWLVEEGIVGSNPALSAIPADAGIHRAAGAGGEMDSRVRGNDEERAELAQMAEDAARLCKADLVTGMVGEFPELQGLIGGYYARAEGLPDAVADAIRDHYKPVGQGDDVPTAPVTVAVSLADKLDTIATFFVINEKPTGSKDPFALRRAAIGVLSLIMNSDLRGEITSWLAEARQEALAQGIQDARKQEPDTSSVRATLSYAWAQVFMQDVRDFFADRLKVQQREAGVRHDLIDAVFALGGEDDLVRLLARVKALQAFVGSEDGANLLAGYKRAANILKKEGFDPLAPSIVIPAKAGIHREAGAGGEMDSRFRGNDDGGTGRRNISAADPISLSYTPEQAEADLLAALQAAESAAGDAVAAERFEDAMAALAMLRAPIDAFFESVTVNDADPDKRAARLAMLARIRDACNRVADFSKIEG